MTLFEYLTADPFHFVSFCFVLSLLVGSFLNVVIYRLPVMMQNDWDAEIQSYIETNNDNTAQLTPDAGEEKAAFNLMTPRSRCGNCGSTIKAWQNIPVLSYLLLGGKCGACKHAISPRYPLIELATAVIAAVIAWQMFQTPYVAFAAIIMAYALIALFWIDYDSYLLPDSITLPLLWLGLLLNTFELFTTLESAVIGAAMGYLILWSIFWLFKLLTGKEGMGYGDFKLLAALGAWLGWQLLPVIIVLSSLVGAVIGIAMIVFRNHDRAKPIPFGPYLAAAGLLALIWGDTINSYYLSLI